MNILLLLSVIAVAIVSASVVDLTPANFDDIVDGSKPVLVKFFAPWCGHCKNMAQDYIKLAEAFESNDDVVIAEVNADTHRDLGSRFGISGFPTLKWFPKGFKSGDTPKEYNSGRDLSSLKEFVNTKLGLAGEAEVEEQTSVTILTPDNFDDIIDGSKYALVEFYAPWCGHCKNIAPIYEQLATALEFAKNSVVIAKIDADKHREIGSKFGVTGFPTFKWFSKGVTKDPESYAPQQRTLEEFLEFIATRTGIKGKAADVPPSSVVNLEQANFNQIVLDDTKNVLVKFYAPWCGHCKNLAPVYEKVADVFQNEKSCVVSKLDADRLKDVAQPYGIEGFPTLKLFKAGSKSEPVVCNGRSFEELVRFLNQECGTLRLEDGSLAENAGIFEQLDASIQKLVQSDSKSAHESARSEAKKLLPDIKESLNEGFAYFDFASKYYLKVFEKVVEKGKNYIAKELSRLERLLSGGKVAKDKVDDITLRRNILTRFAIGGSKEEL